MTIGTSDGVAPVIANVTISAIDDELNGTGPAGGAPQDAQGLSLLAGGFLRCGVDWLPRQNATLLRALSLWLRLDLTGHPLDESGALPRSSMALGLGLGLRL